MTDPKYLFLFAYLLWCFGVFCLVVWLVGVSFRSKARLCSVKYIQHICHGFVIFVIPHYNIMKNYHGNIMGIKVLMFQFQVPLSVHCVIHGIWPFLIGLYLTALQGVLECAFLAIPSSSGLIHLRKSLSLLFYLIY